MNGDDEDFADVSVLFLFWDVALIKSVSFKMNFHTLIKIPQKQNHWKLQSVYICINTIVNYRFELTCHIYHIQKRQIEADACVTQEDKHNQRCRVYWEDR